MERRLTLYKSAALKLALQNDVINELIRVIKSLASELQVYNST